MNYLPTAKIAAMSQTANNSGEDQDLDMFRELNSIKDSLAVKNQPLVPILIKCFSVFREQLRDDIARAVKSQTSELIASKDAEINQLKERLAVVEDENKTMRGAMDHQDQYERKDSVVLTGTAVPDMTASENTHEVVQHLLKEYLDI